jgi:hypothetical protein
MPHQFCDRAGMQAKVVANELWFFMAQLFSPRANISNELVQKRKICSRRQRIRNPTFSLF